MEIIIFSIIVGFIAQLIDGALGMNELKNVEKPKFKRYK